MGNRRERAWAIALLLAAAGSGAEAQAPMRDTDPAARPDATGSFAVPDAGSYPALHAGRVWNRTWRELIVAPYGGFLKLTAVTGTNELLGVQVRWPTATPLAVSLRYELRWDAGEDRGDALVLDLVHRVVGSALASLSATGGWAYWDRHYATAGLRAAWPFWEPRDGQPLIQAWADLRYAAPLRQLTGRGTFWSQLTVALVVPVALGG